MRNETTMIKKLGVIAILVMILVPAGVLAAGYQYRWGGGDSGGSGSGGSGSGSGTSLSADEIYWLNRMREEEKMARDVYNHLYRTWRMNIFSNIAFSEQRHMDAVLNLMNKYGLPDSADKRDGVFNDDSLQALYDDLTSSGDRSRTEALQAGVTVEVTDIGDLDDAIAVALHSDMINVFGNLRAGSYNHLSAFESQLGI
jgi:hypothetical protein